MGGSSSPARDISGVWLHNRVTVEERFVFFSDVQFLMFLMLYFYEDSSHGLTKIDEYFLSMLLGDKTRT